MGKEQEGSLRSRQENVASGAQLGQPAGSGLPIEQAIVSAAPRLEPIEIFPGQPPQQDRAFRKSAKMRAVEATHGAPGESLADILRRLYYTEGKTQAGVAAVLGTSASSVSNWMIRIGVESRTYGPRRQVVAVVGSLRVFLNSQRVEKGTSIAAIAREVERMSGGQVTVPLSTISMWLRKLGIKSMRAKSRVWLGQHLPEATKKKMSEANKKRWQRDRERLMARLWSEEARKKRIDALKRFYATEEGRRKAREGAAKGHETKKRKRREKKLRQLRETLGGDPTEILRRMHWNQGLTVERIAERIDMSVAQTQKLMQYAGVGIRKEDKPGKRKKVGGRVKEEDRETYEQASKAGLTSKLPEKWRYILADRYLTKKPTTLEEVGKKFHFTKERVRQIEQKALQALQDMLYGKNPSYARDRRRLSQPERFREINVLGLSVRARNTLGRANLGDKLRELDAMSDEELLDRVRGFGQKSLRELREALERFRQNLG